MVKPKKYLWRHPKGRWYVRIKSGAKSHYHPISSKEGTEAFDREYWSIVSGKRADAKKSFKVLIELERQSDHWRDLAPRTRRDYDKMFEYLQEKIGTREVDRMTQADIYDAMDANKHRVRFANYIPQALNILFKQAIKRRWRTDNPALGIEQLKVPKERRQPHLPWPDWAVERFRSEAVGLPCLIFEIGVGSVQRPGDWIEFCWGDYDGTSLRLRQNKTDKPLMLPCTERLRDALDEKKSSLGFAPLPSRPVLTIKDGSAMSYRYMADIMLAERKRLGLEAFDLHVSSIPGRHGTRLGWLRRRRNCKLQRPQHQGNDPQVCWRSKTDDAGPSSSREAQVVEQNKHRTRI